MRKYIFTNILHDPRAWLYSHPDFKQIQTKNCLHFVCVCVCVTLLAPYVVEIMDRFFSSSSSFPHFVSTSWLINKIIIFYLDRKHSHVCPRFHSDRTESIIYSLLNELPVPKLNGKKLQTPKVKSFILSALKSLLVMQIV